MEALQQELINVKKLLAERDAMIEVTGVYDIYILMNIYVKTPAISLNLFTFLFIKNYLLSSTISYYY